MKLALIILVLAVTLVGCASPATNEHALLSKSTVSEKKVVAPQRDKDSANVTVNHLRESWSPWSSRKFPEDPPEVGIKGDHTIRVKVSGEVVNQGFYHLESGSSLFDAITAAGGFGPFAVSRFYLVRDHKVIAISIGRISSHYFSPDTAEYLLIWSLQNGDILHVQMVMPY